MMHYIHDALLYVHDALSEAHIIYGSTKLLTNIRILSLKLPILFIGYWLNCRLYVDRHSRLSTLGITYILAMFSLGYDYVGRVEAVLY